MVEENQEDSDIYEELKAESEGPNQKLSAIINALEEKGKKKIDLPPLCSSEFGQSFKDAVGAKTGVGGLAGRARLEEVEREVKRDTCKYVFKRIWPTANKEETAEEKDKKLMVKQLKGGRSFFAYVLDGLYRLPKKSSAKQTFFPEAIVDKYTRIFIGTFG